MMKKNMLKFGLFAGLAGLFALGNARGQDQQLIEKLRSIGAVVKTENDDPNGAVTEITFKYTHTESITPSGAKVPDYPMTDELLAQVSRLPKLTHLELNMCTQLTYAGFACLREMTQLKELALPGSRVTDVSMAYLAGLTNLTYFRMTGAAGVTHEGWKAVSNWKKLETFWVAEGSFRDEDMPNLRELKQLKDISFWGDRVTNVGAEVLFELPNLTLVRVCDGITKDTVAKLQAKYPNCRVTR